MPNIFLKRLDLRCKLLILVTSKDFRQIVFWSNLLRQESVLSLVISFI